MAYDGDPEIRELLDIGDEDRRAGPKHRHARGGGRDRRQTADRVRAAERVPGKQDVITQWSMGTSKRRVCLKMDFLGSAQPDHPQSNGRVDRANDRQSDRSV